MTSFPTPYVGGTELSWLRPLSTWLRWGALALAGVLIAAGQRPVSATWLAVGGGVLAAFALFRSIPALGARVNLRAVLTLEPLLGIGAILVTGGFASPYAICVAVPLLFLAMAVGWRVVWIVGVVVLILAALETFDADTMVPAELGQAVVPMIIAATVGVLARRVLRTAEDTQTMTLGRLQELTHVNALLSTLHDLVRTTPTPLTIEAVMTSVAQELEELFHPDAIQLLIADRGGRFWRSGYTLGAAARSELSDLELPPALTAHARGGRAITIEDLGPEGGLDPDAAAGTYVWLWSQGRPTGLLAIEHHHHVTIPPDRVAMLDRLAPPLGLAIDNAIWFGRLRTLGADQERQRLGAELHDQFAQSLVYVAMELDRTADRHPEDEALDALRTEVRSTLSDLRDTLRELRLRVTEERDLVTTLREHLERFAQRYDMRIRVDAAEGLPRPPLPIENQLLRIAQDLVVLARREGGADAVSLTLSGEAGRLRLVVGDNGSGREESDMGHQASEALSLVRERADAIGGVIDVLPHPGSGTEIAVTVRGII